MLTLKLNKIYQYNSPFPVLNQSPIKNSNPILAPLKSDTVSFSKPVISFRNINYEDKFSKNNLEIVKKIAEFAKTNNTNVYLIGGVVRDMLLGEDINDLDFLIEGDAVEFTKQFHSKYPQSEIEYLKDNFATAKLGFNGEHIDLASTREESYIRKGIPNVSNVGCSIEKDVKRRDFTINAMALKLDIDEKGKLRFIPIDITGGLNDLNNGIISATYDDSFNDDPTRILRGLKFRLRYGFKFDEKTQKMQDEFLENPPIEQISMARVYTSLREKLFKDKDIAPEAYKHIIEEGLYKLFAPETLANPNWANRIKEACEIFNVKNIANVYIKMLDNNVIKDVINNYDGNKNPSNYDIYKKLHNKSNEDLAVYYSITGDTNAIKYYNELKYRTPLLNGKALIEMGYTPGKQMGSILDNLLKEKLNNNSIKTINDEIQALKMYN